MKLHCHIYLLLASVLAVSAFQNLAAQPGFKVDIKKPKPYEERLLKAEKTPDGKLKTPKRIMQNLTTRFNYYFNANNKFNEVLDRAKSQHKDDYSSLLSFYNYDLETTAADSAQLDSVIYKARTGIINHDLRNEWIDELYLLWGASFHLQKKLDSAALMFQFINYAYAPQEEAGFYTYIGTRKEGAKELSIATKEDKKFLHSNTFSRNNAFIWQIKTLIELGDLTSAGSLITTLKRDPVFPKRLDNGLEEAEAYWWYKQQRWDSAAAHLIVAIDGTGKKAEKARWEYLAAQLLERSGKADEAAKWYAKAISLTPDPVMEVYGRLNLVRISKEGGENAIDKNVAELLKMAKKDKYEEYRDIIYYMAAQMEMERNNIVAAQELLIKGSKYNNGNLASRSKAFLQIADVSYDQKKYLQAASFYDSIQTADLKETEVFRVNDRKLALQKVVLNTNIVTRQDSLQRIAAMPLQEREAYINKMVKRLRKEQGLKEDILSPTAGSSNINLPQTDLFPNQQKGEWYFYNTNLKAQGAAQFKQVWGSRPNIDNWRRYTVVSQKLLGADVANTRGVKDGSLPVDQLENNLTADALAAKLPTTADALQASNDSIKTALFNLGAAYLNDVEDYPSAINAYEELRKRFPDAQRMDEILFNLYYAYTKAGNTTAAAQIKKLLQEKFASSRYTAIITTGKDPQAKAAVSPQSTKEYERIYNLFIEGKFDEAEAAKRIADSTYQTNFWQPQLLYIEAVYNIRQRNDSVAKNILNTLVSQNSNTPLAEKAQNLMSVLSRRSQIEDELNKYQIQGQPTDTVTKKETAVVQQPTVKKDTVTSKPKEVVVTKPPIQKPIDTLVKKPVVAKSNSIYTHTPDVAHFAVVVLDKVDIVFASEAKNAFFRYNRERYYKQPLDIQTLTLNNDTKLLLISNFATSQAAVDYAVLARSQAASQIVPWLTANKYSFTVISAPNLELLKTTTDMVAYKKFLEQYLPGKF
jgi:tetratricopeptide (TPR) repeat protein